MTNRETIEVTPKRTRGEELPPLPRMQYVTIKLISEAEAHYHQTLNNRAGKWAVLWWDGEFQRAVGGFETGEDASEWLNNKMQNEYGDSNNQYGEV